MELNELTSKILKCAYTVHTELGAGLLESAYEECLFYELKQNGLRVEKQTKTKVLSDFTWFNDSKGKKYHFFKVFCVSETFTNSFNCLNFRIDTF